jgi:hypothetical protein
MAYKTTRRLSTPTSANHYLHQLSTMSPTLINLETACVLHGAKDMKVEQRTIKAPREGEAQVQVVATGLCGSDCAYYSLASIFLD